MKAGWLNMKISQTIKRIVSFAVAILFIGTLAGCSPKMADQRNHVKVLILPKFEVDAISGDFPGEAQCFYQDSARILPLL